METEKETQAPAAAGAGQENYLRQIGEIYGRYMKTLEEQRKKLKPFDGMLGLGKKLGDDPCHEAFLVELKAMLEGLGADVPPGEIAVLLRYIYEAQNRFEGCHESAIWTLLAAHGTTLSLIPRLEQRETEELLPLYVKLVPRTQRLPVHKTIIKKLKEQSKNA